MLVYAISMPTGFEWIPIVALVLIVFGAGRLPQVLEQMGKGVKAFRDAQKDGDGGTDVSPKAEKDIADAREVKKDKAL